MADQRNQRNEPSSSSSQTGSRGSSSLSQGNYGNQSTSLGRRGYYDNPFLSLHEQMNRLFDDFLGFPAGASPASDLSASSGSSWPRVDVSYDPERVHVAAELPGVDEKDVRLTIDRGQLVVSGERKSETSESARNWSRRERVWGAFQRVIPLPDDVVADKAEAKFDRGVLTVDLPRQVDERNRPRQIPIGK
jgi:HSP20 family protein